jgi:hypothetical protein
VVPKLLAGYYNINQADLHEKKLGAYSQYIMEVTYKIIRPVNALNLEQKIHDHLFGKRW